MRFTCRSSTRCEYRRTGITFYPITAKRQKCSSRHNEADHLEIIPLRQLLGNRPLYFPSRIGAGETAWNAQWLEMTGHNERNISCIIAQHHGQQSAWRNKTRAGISNCVLTSGSSTGRMTRRAEYHSMMVSTPGTGRNIHAVEGIHQKLSASPWSCIFRFRSWPFNCRPLELRDAPFVG